MGFHGMCTKDTLRFESTQPVAFADIPKGKITRIVKY
jgi:hypothetical protein